ncbi:outer membrane protein transport protein [Rhodobacter capsulatus]|uniref:outer membrane protein transport protein n=1 Tax=Rhodobacter capsulatus TaxID=1061 RepID=UPI0003D2E6F4|nr:outer membrane protein transport protein [Rhodobacter capsulatus]ETD84933.1 membrane protein [Rhodobacter capsulatus YW1]
MKKILMTASALALGATAATAGGIERSSQSVGILFEKGNYVELNFGGFSPDVNGVSPLSPGNASGDMTGGFGTYSLGYKRALNEKIDFALVLENAIGADVGYPVASRYPLRGTTAQVDNMSLTAMMRYKMPKNVSLIGGVRALRSSGEVSLPAVGGYKMSSSTETDVGYLVGVAWEKPEIAARVALTYNSKITHDFTAYENFSPVPTMFPTTIPESVNLEFQTGIAKDTLVFGSVRWVHWKQFDITPPAYDALRHDSLVDYKANTTTYTLGLGRKFSDQWSGAVVLGYEGASDEKTGQLGPTDGFRSIALAGTYQATENVKVTVGVRYVDIGDATTNKPILGEFSSNSGWGAGVRVGISF